MKVAYMIFLQNLHKNGPNCGHFFKTSRDFCISDRFRIDLCQSDLEIAFCSDQLASNDFFI